MPLIAVPPLAVATTPSSALVVDANHQTRTSSSALSFFIETADDDLAAPASRFPDGIDYGRWAGVVRPSPRDLFADRLDMLDDLDDD